MSDYSDLEQFDQGFVPTERNSQFRPGLDSIPDGDYSWSIVSAELTTTQKSETRILRTELRCEELGKVIERVYFLTTQEQADRLGGDLATLGYDVGTWTAQHGKKFSAELVKAVMTMAGRRFKGTKKTAPNKNQPEKPYHNLYINAPLSGLATAPIATHHVAAPSANEIPF